MLLSLWRLFGVAQELIRDLMQIVGMQRGWPEDSNVATSIIAQSSHILCDCRASKEKQPQLGDEMVCQCLYHRLVLGGLVAYW